MSTPGETRAGLFYGFTAYGLWGMLPLYWHLMGFAGPFEVLAQRMAWSLPAALVIVLVMRRRGWLRPLLRQPKQLGLIALTAGLISVNWAGFIWAVDTGRVLETSLGYFINPLVSITFGVLLLRERLRSLQWVAVGIGVVAVAVLTVGYGRLPWLSLMLAFSFGCYGLVKKRIKLDGVESFAAETGMQFLPAVGFLVVLTARGDAAFGSESLGNSLLLVSTGIVTAVPLIFFGSAAVRLPLSTIGLLQYSTPAGMFLLGLTVFNEEMPTERLLGFLLVWAALVLLSWDALHNARRNRNALRKATTAADRAGQTSQSDRTDPQPAVEHRPAPASTSATAPSASTPSTD